MGDKINVLDENFFELTENEMIDIWKAFARPMEISEEQGDCIERLEELSNTFHTDLLSMQAKLNVDIQEI